MPTKNPRLTMTISPVLHAQLKRLSELTGSSQSGLIAELLEGTGPILKRAIKTLEVAERARKQLGIGLVESMQAAQSHLEAQFSLELEAVDDVPAVDLLEGMENVSRHRRRGRVPRPGGVAPAASAEVKTLPSNRGVRSHDKRGSHGQV